MQNILSDRITRRDNFDLPLERTFRIALFVIFTAAAGQLAVYLPYTPVPVTMQTLFVVLAGMVLGPRDGFYAMAGYLALGVSGVPLFAGFAFGPAVLLGPTGGFLIAFPAAALISGWLSSVLGEGISRTAVSAAGGMLIILTLGTASLAVSAGVSFGSAASLAAAPFIPGELIKIVLACVIIRRGSYFHPEGMLRL